MIDASNITTEALESFDDMMTESMLKVEHVAALAMSIWSEVLRELDLRGRVVLVSGSYEDIGNALIRRTRD